MGGLNVYPEPQYMYPWVVPAMFYGTVLPGEWSDLGGQFHGRHQWGEGRGFPYSKPPSARDRPPMTSARRCRTCTRTPRESLSSWK